VISYTLNRFEPADVEAVVALWQRVFRDYYLSVATLRELTFDWPSFDPDGCWVARDDDRIVGLGMAKDKNITEGTIPISHIHRGSSQWIRKTGCP